MECDRIGDGHLVTRDYQILPGHYQNQDKDSWEETCLLVSIRWHRHGQFRSISTKPVSSLPKCLIIPEDFRWTCPFDSICMLLVLPRMWATPRFLAAEQLFFGAEDYAPCCKKLRRSEDLKLSGIASVMQLMHPGFQFYQILMICNILQLWTPDSNFRPSNNGTRFLRIQTCFQVSSDLFPTLRSLFLPPPCCWTWWELSFWC